MCICKRKVNIGGRPIVDAGNNKRKDLRISEPGTDGNRPTRPQVPGRKPEKDQRLTQCGRYHENGRGLTKNSTSGESDHESISVGNNLCVHHSKEIMFVYFITSSFCDPRRSKRYPAQYSIYRGRQSTRLDFGNLWEPGC